MSKSPHHPKPEHDPDAIGTDELQAVVAEALRKKNEDQAAADAVVSEDTIEAIAAEVGLSAAELHEANLRLEHQHAEERAVKEAHRQAVRKTLQERVWPAVRW